MAACFYGCYSRKRSKHGSRESSSSTPATTTTTKRTVWPAPESPSPLPLPSPERPRLKKLNSHPLPQPEFHELAATIGGNCVKSYDFDTIATLCNHFRVSTSYHQHKPSIFRCALEEGCLPVDVMLFDESKLKQPRITDEAWIASVNSMAQVEQHNLCRVMGFSIKGRRRLIIMEAPQSSSRLDQVLRQLDWDSRLNIALTCSKALDHLHKKSPLLQGTAHGFGAWNVLVNNNNNTVKLQLVLLENNSEQSKASNVRGFGILLLELLSGKRSMEELLVTESADGHGDELFVKWATDMVKDRIKLSSIVDPKLLIHSPSLSAANKLATFALTCLHSDPLHRPTMHQAISFLNSLLSDDSESDQSNSRKVFKSHLLGRSATFCYHHSSSTYYSTSPWRITTKSSVSDVMRSSGIRSAGTSPARYMTSWSTTSTIVCNTCLL